MTQYAPQTPAITGTTPSYSAVTSSDTLQWSTDASFLIVKNGGGSSINVTVVVPGTKYGQANPDIVVAVPAGAERWIGPFEPDMEDKTNANRLITVTYSATTSVTAAYVKL